MTSNEYQPTADELAAMHDIEDEDLIAMAAMADYLEAERDVMP